jgi:hypothetical protein
VEGVEWRGSGVEGWSRRSGVEEAGDAKEKHEGTAKRHNEIKPVPETPDAPRPNAHSRFLPVEEALPLTEEYSTA